MKNLVSVDLRLLHILIKIQIVYKIFTQNPLTLTSKKCMMYI